MDADVAEIMAEPCAHRRGKVTWQRPSRSPRRSHGAAGVVRGRLRRRLEHSALGLMVVAAAGTWVAAASLHHKRGRPSLHEGLLNFGSVLEHASPCGDIGPAAEATPVKRDR